ncbi:glutamate receptor 3-like [Pecten maximus]|uniref:glutamate receptor 3-like n=1 Tax=Pecten maximus TaxID=6579 RepID=UPI001458DFC1|nr:glutamate receptor 3-like [Pecten maximus]
MVFINRKTHYLIVAVTDSAIIPYSTRVIFDHNSRALERAFSYGVETANATENKFKIYAYEKVTDIRDTYQLSSSICEHLKKMVFALVCMSNIHSYDVIQAYSQALEVPVIVPSSPKSYHTDRFKYEIKMNPSIVPAMAEYISKGGWTKVFYFFNSDDDMWRLQHLYKIFSNDGNNVTITARQIEDPATAHDILRRIDKLGVPCTEKIFVLDFDRKRLPAFLKKDIIDIDLKIFYHSGATFTGFQLLNNENSYLQHFLGKWNVPNRNENNTVPDFTTELALMVDGIASLATALNGILVREQTAGRLKVFKRRRGKIYNTDAAQGILCSPKVIFANGHEVLAALKNIEFSGITGNVQFNDDGERVNYTLQIYQEQLQTERKKGMSNRLTKIGHWSSAEGLHLISKPRPKPVIGQPVKIITTILAQPFVQLKENNDNGKPLQEYEGFCVDLLKEITATQLVNFTYKFVVQKDDEYGVKTNNGSWTGMIGEIVRRDADLAVAPLTITKEREEDVDFTKPFMKTGISIMIKRPDKQKPGVFSFKEPLSNMVWVCITVGFLAVSTILFLVGRFSPYEWKENSATGPSDDFSMLNSLWSNLGALMMQGSDIFPRSISGRTAESAWWFFTLILISSYTANLAAFLTVEQFSIPIDSVDALAAQQTIKYGVLAGGSTITFFRESKVMVYDQMWKFMQFQNDSGADIFMQSNEKGWKKVQSSKGKYAFLLEESFNEYFNNRKPCNTMKVGATLNSFGYGIALPLHSEISKGVNLAVLHLREIGHLIRLRQKWWVDRGQCGGVTGGKGKKSLSLSNVSGIFHILIGGLVLAMIISIIEYAMHVNCKRRKKYKVQKKREKALKAAAAPNKGELQPLRTNGSDSTLDNKGVCYTQEYQTSAPANLITFEGITENGQTQL